jgi:regulatory subunit for Cdc7p protein kinase
MRLLQSERLHGTSERDPTQKRHDFQYFSRSSCFVLIEDMRQELATIAAQEYPIPKGREAGKVPWPVLHCHPHSRGPFIAFDEREKKRWEKMQRAEGEKESEREERRIKMMRAEEVKRRAEAHLHTRNGDLRRSVSMNNLHRRVTQLDSVFRGARMVDLDDTCDNPDSANASGYLASGTGGGHIAASGNSVGITSTTGTTSTAGQSLRSLQLPAALRGRIQHQVVTSRKFSSVAADKAQGNQRVAGKMGPPVKIPERPQMLRKSRSTNTLKLPRREEGSKPGYCESCRTKFDDFQAVGFVSLVVVSISRSSMIICCST